MHCCPLLITKSANSTAQIILHEDKEEIRVCERLQTRTLKNTCPENHSHVLKTGGKCDDNIYKQIRVKFHATRASKILTFLWRSDIIKADSKEEKAVNK